MVVALYEATQPEQLHDMLSVGARQNMGGIVMLGLGIEGFTFLHVAISLVALAAGFVAVGGWLSGTQLPRATHLFLWTTVLTNVTGLLFPFNGLLPSHIVALISLVLLAIALYAFYARGGLGLWRKVFVATSLAALYLNAFVLIVQTFLKNPALAALAPTQSEPPFVAAQAITLLTFLALGYGALRRASRI